MDVLTTADDFIRHGQRNLAEGKDMNALELFRRAAEMDGEHPLAFEGAAQAYRNLRLFKAAELMLDTGIKRYPGHASLRYVRSLLLLSQGNFAEGWEDYEYRLLTQQPCNRARMLSWPKWEGERLQGKRILVTSEQGYGDEIMFASCIHDLEKEGAIVTFLCSRECQSIFYNTFHSLSCQVIGHELNGTLPQCFHTQSFDYETPLGSLPRFFRKGLEFFPGKKYLVARDTNNLREKLVRWSGGRPVIGFSWRGGLRQTRRIARSIDMEQFRLIFKTKETVFISIQHDANIVEIPKIENVIHVSALVDGITSLTNLVNACDEIVTVCNTNVHIAGALGKKVNVLAPYSPEWRYGLERMPWYPNVTVIPQFKYNSWNGAINMVRQSISNGA